MLSQLPTLAGILRKVSGNVVLRTSVKDPKASRGLDPVVPGIEPEKDLGQARPGPVSRRPQS